MEKLTAVSELCIQKINPDIQIDPNTGIIRAAVPPNFFDIDEHDKYFSAGGLFIETTINDLELLPKIQNKKTANHNLLWIIQK